jgi:hypothetical protein
MVELFCGLCMYAYGLGVGETLLLGDGVDDGVAVGLDDGELDGDGLFDEDTGLGETVTIIGLATWKLSILSPVTWPLLSWT